MSVVSTWVRIPEHRKSNSVNESQNEAPVVKKKRFEELKCRSGEKLAFGGNPSKGYEQLDKLDCKRSQR